MKVIRLTEELYELLKAALDSSPVIEGADHNDPGHPAARLWRACADAETEDRPS